MCNYLYYWVTVRNSQSYWHLEHMGETLACTRVGAGGWREGASGRSVGWGGRGVTRRGWGKGLGGVCVCVCGGVRSGIFFDISRRYCIVFCSFFNLFFPLRLLPKALISLFHFSGLWRIIKNNTSCCECTSNNQIVLLCHNVQFIYLYIYSGKTRKRKLCRVFSPNNTRDKEEKE